MIKSIPLILLMSFLFSCAGALTVSSRGCKKSMTRWHYDKEEISVGAKPFQISKEYFIVGGSNGEGRKLFIKELLAEKEIECSEVRNLKIIMKQSAFDVFVSFFPLVNKMSLQIEGEKIKIIDNKKKIK
ncbi:hypothetical protein OAT67_06695 [Bacteriovoracaceae bacterium]|nr:hypothetical protein [Bacteriovoracaceae bacterium]